ncbi:hypothetical protein [Klenkia taihuensis]|uniref:Uncharacterized protein n=1 Tax=Klenkia taihuensis TaxID=1225127 RepID=A0A1I1U6W2_9ACTN|nr:hypothetical protein [Klenkia taihuensis]GHE06891.1 hypothetical protein GCM10011381_00580 [Klenkia taihuensis]SFD66434.1 hypothetical protein SAMN05661030_3940 [Klenkia taihuensis]
MFHDPTIVGSWPALVVRVDASRTLERWAETEPALRATSTVADVVQACAATSDHERSDAVLAALVRRAAADNGADDDALALLLHLLSGLVWTTVRQLQDLSPDIVAVVTGELACQIRRYPWRRRPRSIAANLRHDTRHAVLAELRPRNRRHPERGEVLTADGDITRLQPAVPTPEADDVDVVELLQWAVDSGVDPRELELLIATERGRHLHPSGGDDIVAAEHGISTRTLYRRRRRTLETLRAVARDYLAAVA